MRRLCRRGWRAAKAIRPEAYILTEEEALHPCGRGWTWQQREGVDLWDAVQPSRWPEDPPDSRINNQKMRQLAEATYMKKNMYYNMRIKTMKRNTTNIVRKAQEAAQRQIESSGCELEPAWTPSASRAKPGRRPPLRLRTRRQ